VWVCVCLVVCMCVEFVMYDWPSFIFRRYYWLPLVEVCEWFSYSLPGLHDISFLLPGCMFCAKYRLLHTDVFPEINSTDRVRIEKVLLRVKVESNVVHTIKRRKNNWIGHILHGKSSKTGYWRKKIRNIRSNRKAMKKT
jgi:hypothetical protein